jgi:hypothetical protein
VVETYTPPTSLNPIELMGSIDFGESDDPGQIMNDLMKQISDQAASVKMEESMTGARIMVFSDEERMIEYVKTMMTG